MRRTYVYRDGKAVEVSDLRPTLGPAVNFHQQTINTFYTLECSGALGRMSTREKKHHRSVHEAAQHRDYWPDRNFGNSPTPEHEE